MIRSLISIVISLSCLTSLVFGQSSTCTTITDTKYSGTHCPSVVPQMTLTHPVSIKSAFPTVDDNALHIALEFPNNAPFKMYGLDYRYVWIGTNNVLSFGLAGVTGVPISMPLSGVNLDKLPVIAPFWTDAKIQVTNTLTDVIYSRETINGVPAFVVRYQSMDYLSSLPIGGSTVTLDVILYAGSEGKIEIRYYDVQMPSILTRRVNVGLLSDDTESGLFLHNYENITPAIAASMSQSTMLLTYHGPDVATALCGGLGYDLSSLSNYELRYENTTALARYAFKMCGVVSQCGGTNGDISMMCQQTWVASTGVTTNVSLSIWNPSSAYWTYPATTNGVTLTQADGTYCSTIAKGRSTITNFVCDSTASTPVLVSVSQPRTCVFNITIRTSAVCGRGNRDVPVPDVETRSTLTSCQSFSGRIYDATLCPRASTDPWFTPEPMTNPTAILSTSTGTTLLMDMPFPFFFYETRITRFYVASSGLIEFGTSNIASTNNPFPSMGFTTTDYWPMIVGFWTQLSNYDNTDGIVPYTGSITWSFENTSGNRHLIFRYKDVSYYSTREHLNPQKVSFDIVLTEGEPGGIEIRYYRVDEHPLTTTVIGLRGLGDDMTIVQNEEFLTPALAGKLRGTTLRYRFTGFSGADFCIAGQGHNDFSSLSAYEMNFNSSTYAYYYRPCETVTAAKCRAQYGTTRSTLCRAYISTTTTTLNMAADAPTSTTWEVVDSSHIRATYASGSYCSTVSGPRVAIVDYICNSAAVTPFISSLVETTTCNSSVVVQTVLACASCTPLSSSGVPAVSSSARGSSSSSTASSSSSAAQHVSSSSSSAAQHVSSSSSSSSAAQRVSSSSSSAAQHVSSSASSSSSAAQHASSTAAAPTTSPVPSSSSANVVHPSSSSSPGSSSSAGGIPSWSVPGSSSGSGTPITDDSSKSSGLSSGAIAGIVIGVIVGVLLLICLAFAFCVYSKRSSKPQRLEDQAEHSVQHDDQEEHETHDNDEGEAEEVEMQTV